MRKAAKTRAQNFKAYLPSLIADLHCDTLTSQKNFKGHVNLTEHTAVFQCYAAFSKDNGAAAYAAAKTLFYNTFSGEKYAIVKNYAQLISARQNGKIPCALTCENIGFTGGKYENVLSLKADGVVMASLVWNTENALAYPNVRANNKRERRGLKDEGLQALKALDECRIIVDISHLSDGGAYQILKNRTRPAIASHSCCNSVCRNCRNLTDNQLKLIADCGGVVGINFYKKFLGGSGGFEQIAAHIKHIIKIAGEDTPAFGSDWDGVPQGQIAVCPRNMPELLNFLQFSGISCRVVEKIAFKNFERVFKEVLRF